jgi:hypothetical protein
MNSRQGWVYTLAVALVVSGVGIGGNLGVISGTGTGNTIPLRSQACISNINSTDPNVLAVRPILQQISAVPEFIQYSNGRCWAFESFYILTTSGSSQEVFTFTHFTNLTWYPCGPSEPGSLEPDAIIHVAPSFSTDRNVTGVSITTQQNLGTTCPAGS